MEQLCKAREPCARVHGQAWSHSHYWLTPVPTLYPRMSREHVSDDPGNSGNEQVLPDCCALGEWETICPSAADFLYVVSRIDLLPLP